MFDDAEQKLLLECARSTLTYTLANNGQTPILSLSDYPESLKKHRSCYVTLKKNAKLRGCLGSIKASHPLIEDVVLNTVAAAFKDTRFTPVTVDELEYIAIELSVLDPIKQMNFAAESDLLQYLARTKCGLYIKDEQLRKRALFLPTVWTSFPDPTEFVAKLKHKAQIEPDYWGPNLKVYVFEAVEYSE